MTMNLTLALTTSTRMSDSTIDPQPFVPTSSAPETDDEPALSSFARCSDGNGTLSFLFFSDDDLQLAQAKAICRTCGMQDLCLLGAIEREEPYGVWGGKLVLDGVPVEFKRKRGRPPKHPKPLIVVDEAPIPAHLIASSVA
jgi:WhiB family transcriptional regulator, redox-sensing transcriptional regulator